MSENTKIQWATHTFNPWFGCHKVSPGCAHCYAETLMDHRLGKVKWGKGQPRQRTSAANWRLPVKWNRERETLIAQRRYRGDFTMGRPQPPPNFRKTTDSATNENGRQTPKRGNGLKGGEYIDYEEVK